MTCSRCGCALGHRYWGGWPLPGDLCCDCHAVWCAERFARALDAGERAVHAGTCVDTDAVAVDVRLTFIGNETILTPGVSIATDAGESE